MSSIDSSGNQKDISRVFAEYIAATRFEDLPPAAVTCAKNSVLDTIGVILGASGVTPGLKPLVEFVKEEGVLE